MKNKYMLLTAIILTIVAISGFRIKTQLGGSVGSADIKTLANSPNFDKEKEAFKEIIPSGVSAMFKKKSFFTLLYNFYKNRSKLVPSEPLPFTKPNMIDFVKPSDKTKVIWLGHSSLMLNVEGKIILIDPIFSENASPLTFMVKRFQDPIITLQELPDIDYILISHDHFDHLDMKTVKFFSDKSTKFITPLGLGVHLSKWGISSTRINEFDWWQSKDIEGITFSAAPTQHQSARSFNSTNQTLWASWIIKSGASNLYFSGDGGYGDHFKKIGEKYGPFDMAFMESGQYNEDWHNIHMLPHEWPKAYNDVKAKHYLPIHYGVFYLAPHHWYEPLEKLERYHESGNINLITPMLGETIYVSDNIKTQKWWKHLM
ncbi:hydrolase [Puteibacter caeruleilacunae]|nr:hydrolase [Puteibacter caeruleilacunae]